MHASIFNLRVPLEERNEVFLMNTLTDAQMVVSPDVAALLDRIPDQQELAVLGERAGTATREALSLLAEHGFLTPSREYDRATLNRYLSDVKSSTAELHVTLLTTLQCNFACDYCYQGDHGDYNKFAEKMTLETAGTIADWIERELDRVNPEKLTVIFFGGEPLLNLPVMYLLSERLWNAATRRGVPMSSSIITNGLLLTDEIVDRMLPYGLRGVKITLDGDKDAHNRLRPLRGGQGTFDKIIENMRRVSGKIGIAVGGNFEDHSVDTYPALLDFLKQQEFAEKLVKVNFKPIVRNPEPAPMRGPDLQSREPSRPDLQSSEPSRPDLQVGRASLKGILPLVPVNASGVPMKPLGGTCMTSAGAGGASSCDSCNVIDDQMTFLRGETRKRGFATPDGVHNGPCHVHLDNAHTIGPDGSLYACPGFTGDKGRSVGHIDARRDPLRAAAREDFDRLSPWNDCGDCAFVPVCAGGCVVASHTTLGDMNTPTCHKRSFESAVIELAHQVAGTA